MITGKVRAPVGRPGLLVRRRLLDALDAGSGASLTLVSGVAGLGKTTLVQQWVSGLGPDRAVAWLTVDSRDNDPRRFWTYVAAALQQVDGRPDWSPGQPVGDDDLERLAERAAAAPLVLVLDDMQFLVDPSVLDQLDRFASALPEHVRLLLVSRTRPQLRLARRTASHELVEIEGQDLLFTAEETAQVLRAGVGADDGADVVERLQRTTGGWPVAVALTAQLGRRDGASRPDPVGGARRHVADYLTEEVLRAQPEDVQQFLLDTCLLDELTVASANAVRDRTDSAGHLDYLDRHAVFLTAVDVDGEETFRHQALVRDHLRQLLEQQPERWRELHRRAAAHFGGDDLERAVGHALAAPDADLAADLVETSLTVPARIDRLAGVGPVLHWLEAMPDDVIRARPTLRALALTLSTTAMRRDLIGRWLPEDPTDSPGVDALFAQAWEADSVGDLPLVHDSCRRALALCDPSSHWWRTLNAGLADVEYALGHLPEAEECLRWTFRPVQADISFWSGSGQETNRAFPAVVRARLGDERGAAEALTALEVWLAEVESRGYTSVGVAAWARAMVAHHRGDLGSAAGWEQLPSDDAFTLRHVPPIVFRLDLARVRRSVGDAERAAELVADARRRLGLFADAGGLPGLVAAEEAALGLAAAPAVQRPTPAPGPQRLPDGTVAEPLSGRELEVLRLLRSEFSVPEIAAHLFLSYNTVKTHTRTIYRKLGVSTRSRAVARARELGYI